jgi:Metallo-peptidase family M12
MKENRISSILRSKLLRGGLLAVFLVGCAILLGLSGARVSSQTSEQPRPPQARNENKRVSRLVEDAKRAGRTFPTREPFDRQTRSATADANRRRAVTAGTILPLRRKDLAELLNSDEPSLTLRIPTHGGPPVELELMKVSLFAPGFNVTTSTSSGAPVTYQHGVHYWGVVKGIDGSLATISVFNNELIGAFSLPQQGNFVVGKLAGNNPQGDHILYAEDDLTAPLQLHCEMPDDNTIFSPEQLDDSFTAQVTRCVKVYIEADFDLFQNRGSVGETVNYVTAVFNQSAALYSNEGIPISISEIFVWTTPSPYNAGDSQTQLGQFQSVRTSFNGDIAHLVDLQRNQGGIAAGFNGFCNLNRSQSQCYSGIDPFFSDVPTFSWTVYVFTHEMGHLFGSRHTHACVWNGNGTAIDGCGPAAGFSEGCNGPVPPGGGTIMSYCHLNAVGVNFSLGFGPQPGNVIRNGFNGASCLGTCGDPGGNTYTTAFQSSGGFFVVAEGGGGGVVNANRTAVGSWETFTLIDLNGGNLESGDLVNIQSATGHYVVAEGGGGDVVNANRTIPDAWETFRIERIGGGSIGSGDSISLQAFNGWNGGGGNFVVAEGGGGSVVNANRGAVGPWETFTIHIF